MKIYLAAKFERRPIVRPYATAIWELGHEIVSTWLHEVTKPPHMSQDEFMRKLAMKDLCEIKAADIVIVDTLEPSDRGGKEVELGFALGQFQAKSVWIVGPPRNVFHYLVDRIFDDWDECLLYLKEGHYAVHSSGQ